MNTVKKVVHSVPGRTRLSLRKMDISDSKIEAIFRSMPGIVAATYSPITCTVVLYHSFETLPRALFAHIHSAFQFHKTERNDKYSASFKREMKDLSIVFGGYVLEKMGVAPVPYLTPVAITTLYACRDIIKKGLLSILKPNPDTLTAVAMIASIVKGSPKSALVVYVMSTISEGLSEYTMNRTRKFVGDMMKVDTACVWRMTENGQQEKVKTEEVNVGDRVIVFHGDKIPFDGTVVAFEAQVDQSAITGEYMPVDACEGTYVYAGSIIVEGKIIIQVDQIGEDLTVNRMIKLIEEAQDKQANIQMMSEKFTNAIVPVSLSLAGGIYVLTRDWNKVLNMLVIDYVCGVKLSTATAISATIGKAARKGILLKGGQTIETLSKVDTVILDKTGTITEGEPIITQILPFNGFTEEEVLAYAASAEEHSSHPIAEAIRSKAYERHISIPEHDDESLHNVVGKGVKVLINNEEVFVGSISFMKENHIFIDTEMEVGIFVAKEKTLLGVIVLEDKIRVGMNEMIRRLRKSGVKEIIMLTGDYEDTAKKVSQHLSLNRYVSEALPEDKVNFVKYLKEVKKKTIMMVGDGINDAPALAYADIGITMGAKKTDIAMETADIVIHSENPLLIAESVEISKEAMRTIKQNLFATMFINTGAILLGTFGVIKPVTGAAIHNTSTLALVLNSARLISIGKKNNGFKIQNNSLNSRENLFMYPVVSQYSRLCE